MVKGAKMSARQENDGYSQYLESRGSIFLNPSSTFLCDLCGESHAGTYARKCSLRNRPVCDRLHAAISSGVPVTTTSPPACPPSGPRSIT
jgi:hypothetical protein